MTEVRHSEFTDSEGQTFIIESEDGVISIQTYGGHIDELDEGNCAGCEDCIETVALFAVDAPKIIVALQRALQHAATTGEYGRGETISGQCVDVNSDDPFNAVSQLQSYDEPDMSPDSPHYGKPHEDCCK
ncbi:hypothetical protein SEA_STEVIEBAY_47 [Arthrobacter phage StevieBAY]|uniref:Uncharacterized protein n=1 Tax=Arthrobacter phage StevieBAY TaxID=2725609 RepID=A0A6M3T553_9CAUD|nr:hypothetical protein SEA_STEVIEBAY_47 [Arthrobacter phage StevieBAY]